MCFHFCLIQKLLLTIYIQICPIYLLYPICVSVFISSLYMHILCTSSFFPFNFPVQTLPFSESCTKAYFLASYVNTYICLLFVFFPFYIFSKLTFSDFVATYLPFLTKALETKNPDVKVIFCNFSH